MTNIPKLLPSRLNFITLSFQASTCFLTTSKSATKPLIGTNLGYMKLNKVWGILTAAQCPCYRGDCSLPGKKLHVSQLLLLVESTERMQTISSGGGGEGTTGGTDTKTQTTAPQHFLCISCKWHITGWVTMYSHFWSTSGCCSRIEELNTCSVGNVNPFQLLTTEGLKENIQICHQVFHFMTWHE